MEAVLPRDFALEDRQQSNGLCHHHRSYPDGELYFLSNLQSAAVDQTVSFRVTGLQPEQWNAQTGEVETVSVFSEKDGRTHVPMRLEPWGSTVIVFRERSPQKHATSSELFHISRITESTLEGIADRSGEFRVELAAKEQSKQLTVTVPTLPSAMEIEGPWQVRFDGIRREPEERELASLQSWTEIEGLRDLSGTALYQTTFRFPMALAENDIWLLDLGEVAAVAEVHLNGERAGSPWMQPYRLDVTKLLRSGGNQLRIKVANTLIHHVAALSGPPPIPEELRERYVRPAPLYKPWRRNHSREYGYEVKSKSGLLGPVRLVPRRVVRSSLR
jgi:hypothetical protein